MLRMTADEIDRFLAEVFPDARGWVAIEHLAPRELRVRMPHRERFLRPGGTVSGPTLMTLADTAMYYLVLAHIGPVRDTFTSSLDIHFLRRPGPRDLLADVHLLKLGRRLAVGAVTLCSDDDPAPVAHATVTYSIPPLREA